MSVIILYDINLPCQWHYSIKKFYLELGAQS